MTRIKFAAYVGACCVLFGFVTWLIDLLEGYKPLIDIGLEG